MGQHASIRAPFVEDGHPQSPIQNPRAVRAYLASDLYKRQIERVDGLLDYDAMSGLWRAIRGGMVTFPHQRAEGFRYFINNNRFRFFDSAVASAMLAHHDPRQIVQIGGGAACAAMFDTVERMRGPRLKKFTFVNAGETRLDELDPPALVEQRTERAQDVDPALFEELEAGDILFLDSSHVMKAASDVHYLFLHVLPALKPGVVVHVQDVFYPFEYPRKWLLREGRAWNEAYMVDMMLSHGPSFEVLFFNHAMIERRPEVLNEKLGLIDRHDRLIQRPIQRLNGSIWLRKR